MPATHDLGSLVERFLAAGSGKPEWVRKVDLHFGEDSLGDPAARIVVTVSKDLEPTKDTLAELQAFSNRLRGQAFESELPGWPYVEIVTE